MGRLDGKVAVVTGAGNGIGRACCERFAEEGASIVVADVLDAAGAETVAVVEGLGRKASYQHVDVASPSDVESLVAQAVETFGAIDVLVTAAGISHAGYESGNMQRSMENLLSRAESLVDPILRFTETPLDEWQRVIDVNLTGTFLCVREVAKTMAAQGRGGSIVTIASVAAKHPEAAPASYCVSKAGVWMLTKQAAVSLAKSGIRVNAIGPGYIETNMTAIIREMPDIQEQALSVVPMGRMGTPREVANAALFLASDESSYFTGEILHPDGGFYTD
jgi:NAD(P)-dependent dehydrogenase (short-subunit alcohol dehydrogenase family)